MLGRENGRRAIAVVDIAVNRHRPLNPAELLHLADRDRHIVDHAKAFAMIGMRVMEASADVHADPIIDCFLCSENRAARC